MLMNNRPLGSAATAGAIRGIGSEKEAMTFSGRSLRVAVGLLVACGLSAVPLRGQIHPDEFTIAGWGIGFADLVVATAVATVEIEAARQRFWELYPDKPGFEEASAHFADLLWHKDQLYMAGYLMEGVPLDNNVEPGPRVPANFRGPTGQTLTESRNLAGLVFKLAGGIDGGIEPTLGKWFFDWVRAVRREMGAKNDQQVLMLNIVRYPGALAQAEEEYREYARRRDFGELLRGPKSPLRTSDPRQYLAYVLMAGDRVESLDEAYELARMLHEFVGGEAIAKLIQAPRRFQGSPYMPGTDSSREIQPWQYDATRVTEWLFSQLRRASPESARHWLATIHMPHDWSDLPGSVARVQDFINQHGEARVLDAVERMRSVGRYLILPEYLADYSGHRRELISWWLARLLEDPEFLLPTITEPVAIDARNRALLEEAARHPVGVRIIGKVSRARWDRTGSSTYDHHLRLHVEGADHLHYSIRGKGRVLYEIAGPEGEKLVGRRIGVFGPLRRMDDGSFEVPILWPDSAEPENIVAMVDDRMETASELPQGIAERAGLRVPGAEGTPDHHAMFQVRSAHDRRLDSFFRQRIRCRSPEGEYILKYATFIEFLHIQRSVRLGTHVSLDTDDLKKRGIHPSLAVRRSFMDRHRQTVRLADLDWDAVSVSPSTGDCLLMRVPVATGEASVQYMVLRLDAENTEEDRSYLELRVPDRATADQLAALLCEYAAAEKAGWTTMPSFDDSTPPLDLSNRRAGAEGRRGRVMQRSPSSSSELAPRNPEDLIQFDGMRISFRGTDRDVVALRAAAEAADGRACFLLGELIGQGHVEGGAVEAVRWFERGHMLGNAESTARLALHLLMSRGVDENDPRRAERNIRHLAQTAAHGNSALGLYLYAECIAKGIGAEADPAAASPFYQRAAALGNALAKRWCEQNGVSY
jgi:TPR repeat protein